MVSDKDAAKEISDLALRIGKELDQSVAFIKDHCDEEETEKYKRAVGKVMGELLLEIMNPLYRLHPDIKPSELHLPAND